MAGIIDSMMQGYTERILGKSAREGNAAQNTAEAYKRLQAAIADDYNQQKTQFESNPANSGQSWTPPGTAERYEDQVQAMIMSGDPGLTDRGLALISSPKESGTEFQKNFEYLNQSNPNMTQMDYFRMLHPGPSVTNINLPKQDQPMTLSDLQNLRLPNGQPVPVGTSMREAGQMGASVTQTEQQSTTGSAIDAMGGAAAGMQNDIGSSPKPLQGATAELRNRPGLIGQGANVALNVMGIPNNQSDVRFISNRNMYAGQLTRAMNGAGASDQEREYWMSQMPNLTDDPATRQTKFKKIQETTESMKQRAKAKGVTGLQNKEPTIPQQKVSSGGIKFTVK